MLNTKENTLIQIVDIEACFCLCKILRIATIFGSTHVANQN